MEKLRELVDEFRLVVLDRHHVVDAVLPPLLFVLLNVLFGFQYALIGALGLALLLSGWRLRQGQPLLYGLAGIAAVLLAIVLVVVMDRAEGFFLPGIAISAATALLAVISNLVGRPLVAWTSHITRRWPWAWYRHARVRPAYSEVTWLWALYFAAKAILQFSSFQDAAASQLAWLNLFLGWPGTVLLLVLSYLYGSWRLQQLAGPSVEEFREGAPPPWQSQQRGF